MRTKKVYEVRGMMEWHPEFKVGRTRLKVSFTGGHLSSGGCTPACFETADPVVQRVIEGSEAFQKGQIRVGKVIEQPPVAGCIRPSMPAPAAESVSGQSVMKFKDLDSASDFLEHHKGIPVERLLSKEACIAEGRRVGVNLVILK